MAGLISRRILALFVPTILAFLSAAYWLHRKRKIKGQFTSISNAIENHHESVSEAHSDDALAHNTLVAYAKTLAEFSDCYENSIQSSDIVLDHGGVKSVHVANSNHVCNSVADTYNESLSICPSSSPGPEIDLPELKLDESASLICAEHIDNAVDVSEISEKSESLVQHDSNVNVLPKNEPATQSVIAEKDKCEDTLQVFENVSEEVVAKSEASLLCSKVGPNEKGPDPTENCHSTTAVSSLEDVDKGSPTESGSPLSSGHSSCSNNNCNNNDVSDCEVVSSIGTSSISLNELISVSPIESAKDHSLNFQSDALVDEDTFDSGKGSTVNMDPVSSCSFVSELDDNVSIKEQAVDSHQTVADNFVFSNHHLGPSAGESDSVSQYIPKELSCQASTSQVSSEPLSAQIQFQEHNTSAKMVNDIKAFETSSSSPYIYEFELPQELCGRLIGRHGKHVNYIKECTNASVYIKRHPFNHRLKLAVVEGTRCEVNSAMELIRKKFPPTLFPALSLAQTNAALSALGVAVPESLQLHLPDRTSCDVILSSMVSAGHFFLQQPTHPTYSSLSTLDQCMMACYSQGETPRLPHAIEAGVICAATVMNGWYRAQVMYVHESGEDCEVKFVDYGGYSTVPASSLRQIRSDFMTLPFQASECYLANVQPTSELGWTAEASATFEELAQGQILQAIVVDYHDDGIPYVHLYRVQGISSTFINQELVNRGMAKWIEQR